MQQRPTTAGRRVSFNAANASSPTEATSPTRLPVPAASHAETTTPVRPSFSGLLSHVHNVTTRQVWHQIRDSVVCRPVDLKAVTVADPTVAKASADVVRIVVVSDTHGAHASLGTLPAGDVLVHAGDFTAHGKPNEIDDFCTWLALQTQFATKIVVAGNHELSLDARVCEESGFTAEDVPALEAKLRTVCTYAKHEVVEACGMRFFASPHLAGVEGMAFNLNRRDEAHEKWAEAAIKAREAPFDVLVSHGPALGHLDFIPGLGASGCADLLDFIEAFQPTYHLCGHVHRCHGATTNNKTVFINASSALEGAAAPADDEDEYRVTKLHPPIVIDVPRKNSAAHAAFKTLLVTIPSADTMPGHENMSASLRPTSA